MLLTEKLKRFKIVENEKYIVLAFETEEGNMHTGTFYSKKFMYPYEAHGIKRHEVYQRFYDLMDNGSYIEFGFPIWCIVVRVRVDLDNERPYYHAIVKPDHRLTPEEILSYQGHSDECEIYAYASYTEAVEAMNMKVYARSELIDSVNGIETVDELFSTGARMTFTTGHFLEVSLNESGIYRSGSRFMPGKGQHLFNNEYDVADAQWIHIKPQLIEAYQAAFVKNPLVFNADLELPEKIEVTK